jgi:hypothetical protein
MFSYCTEVYSCILWNLYFFQIKSSRTEDHKFGKVTIDLCRENRTKISNIPSFLWSVSWVQNIFMELSREDWILRGPHSSSFWVPRNLSNHMVVWQVSTGNMTIWVERERRLHYCWRVKSGFKLVWIESTFPCNSLIGYSLKWCCRSLVWPNLFCQKLVLTVGKEINRLIDYQPLSDVTTRKSSPRSYLYSY